MALVFSAVAAGQASCWAVAMASNSSPALEAFTARREIIAGDIAKLEKQVRRAA